MGRAHGLCQLCPQMRRSGRYRTHREDPVQWCDECRAQVCARHIEWDSAGNRWLCRRCDRHAKARGS